MSKIEWTDETWNPFVGCSKISHACDNCYAEKTAARLANMRATSYYAGAITDGKWNGNICAATDSGWMRPFRWKNPKRIFVGSMTDVFHPNVPDSLLEKLFTVVRLNARHTFLLLTKRPERMREFVKKYTRRLGGLALPNVWLGVTAEDQQRAEARIPILLDTPAAKRFVSIEPMLGPVNIESHLLSTYDKAAHDVQMPFGLSRTDKLDWVIAGGESGPGARPSHPDWFRSLRDQCAEWGTPFFFKQWGEWAPDCLCGKKSPCPETQRPTPGKMGCMFRCGKKAAGHLLDRQEWRQVPEVQNA